MTATDELRRLLDERGEDYRVSSTGHSIEIGPYATAYANWSDTTLDVSLRQVTPEQAIDATLGRGTCKVVGHGLTACDDIEFHWYRLNCGHDLRTLWAAHTVGMYCPYCGRKVVDA